MLAENEKLWFAEKVKVHHIRKNKKKLGRSIKEHLKEINNSKKINHRDATES